MSNRTEWHRVTGVDPATRIAECSQCGPASPVAPKPLGHGRQRWICVTARRESDAKRAGRRVRKRQSPEQVRDYHLQRKFGITLAEYDELLAIQGGGCAICGSECRSGRSLAVDHCHETGRVRGLLCNSCNRGLGLFADSADRVAAAHYLRTA